MTHPMALGVLLAAGAAIAFGLTTPAIAWATASAGPLTTASLLYLGAMAAAGLMRLGGRTSGGRLTRRDAPRMALIALAGAVIAPVCLIWGLARVGATAGSLVLNLEAVLTVGLAWLFYREPLGRRVVVAVVIMAAAGGALAFDVAERGQVGLTGVIAVGLATLGWAIDNTLTRALAERDPLHVIAVKGALGSTLTGGLALVGGEPMPSLAALVVLLACGATGYGLSLRLYLLAQRRIGAARTGSVFALAPFVGAAVAYALGDRDGSWLTVVAAVGFAVGVYLHVSEDHAHAHAHPALAHDHAHRHDDGHHDHVHDVPVVGSHSHPHVHVAMTHAHAHAPDQHHDHAH